MLCFRIKYIVADEPELHNDYEIGIIGNETKSTISNLIKLQKVIDEVKYIKLPIELPKGN